MNIKDLNQKFEQLEISECLFENTAENIPTWEIVRLDVYQKLQIHFGLLQKQLGVDRSIKNLLKIFLRNLQYIFFKSPFFIPKNKIVILSTGRRYPNNDGLFLDIYTDYFIEKIGEEKFYLIENMSFSGLHQTPAKTKNLAYSDAFHLLVIITAKLISLFSSKNIEKDGKKIEEKINAAFGTKLNLSKHIVAKIRTYKAEKLLYRLWFKQCQPKMLGVINAPNRKAALVVCKELGIPTFEIQHGTLGKFHLGYYYPLGKQKIAPHFMLFMGNYWKESIHNPAKEENTFIVGHPFLENKQRKFATVPKKKKALFISQALDVIFEFAENLKKQTLNDIEIVVKLHPSEYGHIDTLKKRFPSVEIIGPGTDIYFLLAEAKWVFGIYSTVMFEALKFNCILYGINAPGIEYIEELIQTNSVKVVNNAQEVTLNFDELPAAANGDYFFASNWEQLMDEAKTKMNM
jgi:hypothetical protein